MKNGNCEAVLCGKTLDEHAITVVVEGKAHRYHDVGCALDAIRASIKDIEYQIQSIQEQLKK